ncbi:MAG: cytochrome P460 family protein [Bacteroidetes bacterium]|nr:cytochrome P460 family protein [Bacteroidota bacterium]
MKSRHYLLLSLMIAGALVLVAARPYMPKRPGGAPPLPLPHTMSSPEYQKLLYPFLAKREYMRLKWPRDKHVRDTGPFIDGRYYGTHNAVRVWYSPEVVTWLEGDRKGRIPDGAMIIKEMYAPPAARYDSTTGAALDSLVSGWAVMVRDSIGSKDGWYWSYYGPGLAPDNPAAYPFSYPNSDFGEYCVRCHASAASEFTFSELHNIAGHPGDPLTFRVDNTWRPGYKKLMALGHSHEVMAALHAPLAVPAHEQQGDAVAFDHLYSSIKPVPANSVQRIPPVTYDHVFAGPAGPGQFLTSDQCLSCHDGQPLNLGPNMYIPINDTTGINLSPYGEWNWSMMGLAGRDPIFFAQLESEMKLQPRHADSIQNLCFRCHGVMGDREIAIEHPGTLFNRDMVQITDPHNAYYRYGALARDGISCTVCHQIVDDKLPLDSIFTGQFHVSTPGEFEPGVSNIYGPFDNPAALAMHTSLGMKPVQSNYILSSRLCGSCHTVYLPVYDSAGRHLSNVFEQSTYLEWQNSDYQDEFKPTGRTPRSCQSCHMPTRFPDNAAGSQLAFQIANIQDQTYPQADNRAPLDSITVPLRANVARHTLLGVNQWGLEMFRQFDDILGVRKADYMTSSTNGLPFAIAAGDSIAKTQSARVTIKSVKRKGNTLEATVQVENLAGHRLPSGVGFRRAFLECSVSDASGRVVWASGRTNNLGVIVDEKGNPLPSEFHERDPKTGAQQYQPHYRVINRQDQAQIFEELARNPQGRFTTSFLAIDRVVKDNRLLPHGWSSKGPAGFLYPEATSPHGNVVDDPQFMNGTGTDVITYAIDLPSIPEGGWVTATMYYQAIPPSYLMDRFTIVPDGKATQRLYFIASNLVMAGTNIQNWKLRLAQDRSKIS